MIINTARKHYYVKASGAINPATVLIFPTWAGMTAFEKEAAHKVAEWGFNVIAIDLYGTDGNPRTVEEKAKKMHELIASPQKLQKTISTLIDEAKSLLSLPPEELFTTGYCLGGKLSLLAGLTRNEVSKAASVHGLLDVPKQTPNNLKCSFLILNGYLDPMIPEYDKYAFLELLTEYKLDWQLIEFGQAMHSFTQSQACSPENGVNFHKKSASRSLEYLKSFLEE